MTRRNRTSVAGVGLLAALVGGCLGMSAPRVAEGPRAPADPVAPPPEPAPSDYHARVVEPPPPGPPPVQQVRFPAPPPVPDPPPPVAVPSRPPDAPVVEALRCVLDGRPGVAFDLLQRYDPLSRDALLALLQVAVPLGEGGLEHASPQVTTALLEQLNSLEALLRKRAPLAIEKMCFCREVRAFGKYSPLPPDYAFQTGSAGLPGELVQVYVEVRNVACRPHGSVYETELTGRVEIHDFRGNRVWDREFENQPDCSRTPLRDNYVTFRFNVPRGLPADSAYTLWVYVKDTGEEGVVKQARRSLDFRVRPPARPAAPESGGAP